MYRFFLKPFAMRPKSGKSKERGGVLASIQCAIELYDGVSPVLSEMALSLDNFSGQFTRFAEEMGALTPDIEGLVLFGGALESLAVEAEGAYGVMSALLSAGEGLLEVFSTEIFAPLTEGAMYATGEIADLFGTMGNSITEIWDGIGRHAAEVAGSIPSHFAGPLAQVTGMFQSMAANARAALNSITSSARAAMHMANQVSNAAQAAPRLMSAGGGSEVVSLLRIPNRETLTLPDPEVCWSPQEADAPQATTVNVSVQNENHIARDVDVEAVLREMEERLCDAVASSIEGVYA